MEKWLVVNSFFPPLIRLLKCFNPLNLLLQSIWGWSLTGKRGGGGANVFFLRFSTDAIVLLANWLEKACTAMLLARTPSGIGAAFILGRVFPIEAEKYSTVQLWFIISQLRRTSEALD